MSLSKREILLASATGFVVIGLVTWVVVDPMIKGIRASREQQAKLRNEKIVLDKLIAQRGLLDKDLGELRAQLPRFRQDEQVTAKIVEQVTKIASANSISFNRVSPSVEAPLGDLSEVAIECSWEGTLEGITHFLHAVQAYGAMLDIRQLNIQPAQNTTQAGRLRGNFKLFYAFMREKPGAAKVAAAGGTNVPPAVATNAVPVSATNAVPAIATNATVEAVGTATNAVKAEAAVTAAPPAAPAAPAAPPQPGKQEGN